MSPPPAFPLTGVHVRMARAALHWKVDDLAERTGLPWARLQKAERADGDPGLNAADQVVLREVFEAAGIAFTQDADGRCGVSWRAP